MEDHAVMPPLTSIVGYVLLFLVIFGATYWWSSR